MIKYTRQIFAHFIIHYLQQKQTIMDSLEKPSIKAVAFKSRRQKFLGRKVLPLPILSLKSHGQTANIQIQSNKNFPKLFNPHFKPRKIQEILDQPLSKSNSLAQHTRFTIIYRSKEHFREKFKTQLQNRYRNLKYSNFKRSIFEHMKDQEIKQENFTQRPKLYFKSTQAKKKSISNSNNSDQIAIFQQKNLLKCQSLPSQALARKVTLNLATIQVKNPYISNIYRKKDHQKHKISNIHDDLNGWEYGSKRYETDYDNVELFDICSQQ